jgi:hypothetical protein
MILNVSLIIFTKKKKTFKTNAMLQGFLSKISQVIGRLLGRWAEKVVGYLGVFPLEMLAYTLSVPLNHDFQFITYQFYKKLNL